MGCAYVKRNLKQLKNKAMKEYTFETSIGFFTFYDLRNARKKALQVASEINSDVLVTCLHLNNYKQDWYTATPCGKWQIDSIGFKANN